jgi:hypothetical protein
VVSIVALGVSGVPAAGGPPSNDGVADAVVVSALPYMASFDLSGATADDDDVSVDRFCELEATTHSVWFGYTPAYDSVLGAVAWAGTPLNDLDVDVVTGSAGTLQPVMCGRHADDGTALEAGTKYLLRVGLRDPDLGAGTSGELHLSDLACQGVTSGDLDGDWCPDLAIGLPGAKGEGEIRSGAVEVAYGNGYNSFDKRRQRLTPGTELGVEVQPDSGFGASLAQGRLDEDWFEDLAIGIPRYDAGTVADAGAVLVLFGGTGGLGERRLLLSQGTLPGSGSREAGDRFGDKLAIDDHVLLVGVPGEDVGSAVDAGAVLTFRGFSTGGMAPDARVFSQAGAVAGAAEAGDRFGAALAFGPSGMLLVGAPGEDVGTVTDAGAVVAIAPSGASAIFSQDSSGMGGIAEVGDHFGAAISLLPGGDFDSYRVAIGAPGEDVGGVRDAGVLGFLGGRSRTSPPRPLTQAVGQDTPGIPGVAERGDHFGAVLTTWFHVHELDLVVGVPDEDVGNLANAGAVTVLSISPLEYTSQRVAGRMLTQATQHAAGTPEAGDRLGATITTTGANPEHEDTGSDSVYAGAPGEDLAGIPDAGFAQGLATRFTTISPQTRQAGQLFGAALGNLR